MRNEFVSKLTEDDFVDAYRPAPRPRRTLVLVLLAALVLAAVILVLLVQYPDAQSAFRHSPLIFGLTGAVTVVASFVALLLIAAPALRRRAARSALRDHPGMSDPVHYAFDGERFEVRSTFSQASYPWAEMWDWRETAHVVVVLPTPRNFYVIPKRDVDPLVLDQLEGLLMQARKRRVR